MGGYFSRGSNVSPPRPLRILALHGDHQWPARFKSQLSKIDMALEGAVTFDFVAAPHKAATKGRSGHYGRQWILEEFNLGRGEAQQRAEHERWTVSLNLLLTHISKHGPYDGLLGYSMGTAAATCLLAAFPDGSLPFRFVALFSGYAPGAHVQLMQTLEARKPLRIPSLHVFGTNDSVVPGHCVPSSRPQRPCRASFLRATPALPP